MNTLGLDLGGTKLAIGRWAAGRLTHFASEPLGPDRRPEAVITRMAELCRGLLTRDTRAAGIACAGQIDAQGQVLASPNLGWQNVPLGPALAAELGVRVVVGNDVHWALLGEQRQGAALGSRHCLGVFVGTGIGGGLLLNGQLYEGARGFAGEVGHMTLVVDGPACSCGNFGCWEALASGPALARRTLSAIQKGRLTRLNPDRLGAEDLERAVQLGDLLASEMVHEEGRFLGIGIANLMNLFNPERIVLGGGVIRHLPQLVEMAEQEARLHALASSRRDCRLVLAHWGREAGVIGAAIAAQERAEERPAA